MPIIPVTQKFIDAVSLCAHDASRDCLILLEKVVLWPTVGESGSWSLGLVGYAINSDTYHEIVGATALPDGTFTRASDGARRTLGVLNGAALPSDPPPPPEHG